MRMSLPTAGSLNPSEIDIARAMEVLHDPAQYTIERVFSIDLPFANLVVTGAAHGAAGDIAKHVFSDTQDYEDSEWNQVYKTAFNAYRTGLEAGYLLVRAETGVELL